MGERQPHATDDARGYSDEVGSCIMTCNIEVENHVPVLPTFFGSYNPMGLLPRISKRDMFAIVASIDMITIATSTGTSNSSEWSCDRSESELTRWFGGKLQELKHRFSIVIKGETDSVSVRESARRIKNQERKKKNTTFKKHQRHEWKKVNNPSYSKRAKCKSFR